MASTTIHTLSYKVISDSQQFTKGILAARSEASLLKKVMEESKTPADKYGEAVARLDKLHAAGAISAEQHKAAISHLGTELDKVGKSATNVGDILKRAFTVGAIISTARTVVGSITDTLGKFDQQGDTAQQLGVTVRELQQLHFVGKSAGLTQEKLGDSLGKMQIALGKAAVEGGRAEEALNRVGLSSRDLIGLSLTEQIEELAGGFAKLGTQEEKQLFLKTLGLGRELGPVLDQIAGGLDEAARAGEELGDVLTNLDNKKLTEGAEAVERLGDAWERLKTQVAIAAAPTISAAADIVEATQKIKLDENTKKDNLRSGLNNLLFGTPATGSDALVDKIAEAKVARQQEAAVQKENAALAKKAAAEQAAADLLEKQRAEEQLALDKAAAQAKKDALKQEEAAARALATMEDDHRQERERGDKARQQFVDKLLEKEKSDLDKLHEGIAKIGQAWAMGEITDAEADSAEFALAKELVKDNVDGAGRNVQRDTGPQRPAAVMRGTAEAFSAVLRGMDRDKGDHQKQTRDNTKAIAEAAKMLLEETKRANQKPPINVVGGF